MNPVNEIVQVFENSNIRFVEHPEKKFEFGIVATDLASALDHSNTSMMIDSIDPDYKGVSNVYTLGGNQNVTVIWEPGIYEALSVSRKEKAKPFKKWLFEEVLPSIRKKGSYSLSDQSINLKALARQEEQIKALEHQQEQLNGTIEMMQSEIKSKLYGYDYNIQREIHILGEQIINRFYPNVGWKDKKQAIKETYITHEIFYNYVNSVEERFCKIEWNVFNLSSSLKRNVEILTKRMNRIMDKFESQFKLDCTETTIAQEIAELKKNASVADHHFIQFLEQQAPNTSVDDAYIAYYLRPNT
jgi:prophage antirepressor-like protein